MAASYRLLAVAALILGCAANATVASAQTVFLCTGDERSFAVFDGSAPPDCRALAEPERELQLSGPQPDIQDIARQIARQSARIDRLEQLLLGRRPAVAPPAPRPPRADSFDTQGRTRDLGQDIERRLEGLGR